MPRLPRGQRYPAISYVSTAWPGVVTHSVQAAPAFVDVGSFETVERAGECQSAVGRLGLESNFDWEGLTSLTGRWESATHRGRKDVRRAWRPSPQTVCQTVWAMAMKLQ